MPGDRPRGYYAPQEVADAAAFRASAARLADVTTACPGSSGARPNRGAFHG